MAIVGSQLKSSWLVVSAILVMCSLGAVLEHANGRLWMSDLEVYLTAARRLLAGESLYRPDVDGFYRFKYAPAAAAYFLPLLAVPLLAGKFLYWMVLAACFAACNVGIRQWRRLDVAPRPAAVATILAALSVATHVVRELHLGQVNLPLMAALFLAGVLASSRKDVAAGVVIGLTLLIKPYGLILWAVAAGHRRFRLCLATIGSALLAFYLPIVAFYPWEGGKLLQQGWAAELLIELTGKKDLLAANNQTLAAAVAKVTSLMSGQVMALFATSFSLVLIGICLATTLRNRRGRDPSEIDAPAWALAMALIPLLVATDTNAFIFAWPALWLGIARWDELRTTARVGFGAAAILIGVNVYNLMGRTLSLDLTAFSLCAWGGLLIAVSLISLRTRTRN